MILTSKLHEVTLVDPEAEYGHGKKVVVQHYCVGDVQLVGRNDLCFCGSGKKVKRCHPKINEQSLVAKLLQLYAEIDERNSKAATVCKTGCAKCCSGDFDVHLTEFLTILNYLKIGSSRPEDVQYDELRTTLKEYNISNKWCIFLDQKEKVCKTYAVRPLVCRNYGTTKQATETECEHRKKHGNTGGLLDETDHVNIDTVTNRIHLKSEYTKIATKTQPLILWFRNNVNDDGKLKTQRMRDMLQAATAQNVDAVIRVLQA